MSATRRCARRFLCEDSMIISSVCALARGRVIGAGGKIPWHLPDDLRYFKALTMGKPVLMGRSTFLSLGRPLPGRDNLVLSRDPLFKPSGAEAIADIAQVLSRDYPELMVIGGGMVYKALMPYLDRQYLTLVHEDFAGDAFYPEIDPQEWRIAYHERHERDDAGSPYAWTQLVLERNSKSLR